MNVVQEFSRFADQYDSYNIIQKKVAKNVVSMVEKSKYHTIVDIGCGSGAIFNEIKKNHIDFEDFIALDFSLEMLSLHPNGLNIQKRRFDFNNGVDFHQLKVPKDSLILSSSALQWSKNLAFTLESISHLGLEFHFSFFTSNTFSTLHKIANIKSPIYEQSYILRLLRDYYDIEYEILSYHLEFDETRDMFQYIKRSGVSGGKRQLSYREIKKVMQSYPYNYLEFEILLINAKKL